MTVHECLDHPWLQESISVGMMLTPPPENYDLQLRVLIPDSKEDNHKESSKILPLLKHPHHKDTSLPFPDAPTTPKMIRKSHPDSPTSVLNHCKKFQMDSPMFNSEKALITTPRSKCETGGMYKNGKVVGVLEMCKTFEALPPVLNGKSHAKENKPLVSKNGTGDSGYDSEVIKVSPDSTYTEILKCEVQCCNLVSNHNHTPTTINHVERAILC